jgi:hypothetical protein
MPLRRQPEARSSRNQPPGTPSSTELDHRQFLVEIATEHTAPGTTVLLVEINHRVVMSDDPAPWSAHFRQRAFRGLCVLRVLGGSISGQHTKYAGPERQFFWVLGGWPVPSSWAASP